MNPPSKCEGCGGTSFSIGCTMATCMGYSQEYINGVHHVHNPNCNTTDYRCNTCRSTIRASWYRKCPAGCPPQHKTEYLFQKYVPEPVVERVPQPPIDWSKVDPQSLMINNITSAGENRVMDLPEMSGSTQPSNAGQTGGSGGVLADSSKAMPVTHQSINAYTVPIEVTGFVKESDYLQLKEEHNQLKERVTALEQLVQQLMTK